MMNEMNPQNVEKEVKRQVDALQNALRELQAGNYGVACTILYDVRFDMNELPKAFDKYLDEVGYTEN
jgi:hypothetical protein